MYKHLTIVMLILMTGGMFMGCPRYASPELLAQMEEACTAADEAEARLSELKSELEGLKTEKTAKESRIEELEKRIKELEARKPVRK